MRVGTFVIAAQFPGQGQGEALHRAITSAEAAEAAGLDTVWLAEHHFVPYGVCPSAVTLAGLLLGRTERIGVGTAVSVLPTAHPVALGEQAALLHLASGGRFTLGVGRGGPWVDLEVFGTGMAAFEAGFPESLDLLLRWLREPAVGADGPRYAFREVPVVPRADEQYGATATDPAAGSGPPVVVACTSPGTVRLAAERGLPMLLGMHCGDEDKAAMVAMWRETALAAGRPPEEVAAAGHVSAGVAQVADTRADAVETLLKSMPGWLARGLGAHRTVDGSARAMRDPHDYTEMLCDLHPVGPPRLCADRLAATAERTGITRFALLVEGSGDLTATLENVARLGADVLPELA
ncbi:Flavin-dependent oxidoreductase, luciferase family (includes alkanesulfonate monooxygenase SsuD and methylene tetrahydromethanopterin reductase) [Actinacidiphila alni]|uniref:Flavin-dependent oxidoreductase, luciferase family (Includes alkanesulfonate monooxygenase SsuD and methylene tetrahydromethanopterin reductase) n=1 Tax=Actinacidiphila alni TaxID=380248 RepID=A0A1I2HZE6_9ACTN|nr:LLM class flavin-dependent oxidoreductase [Actinacidiphila alni]SFF34730.1 Flavin-dependent oxidoreductase, luciferase family (includes alkanesulfonate monooxygenase SsuD and methylene tetrahydromethanopterin reductase) [Actinacidiphila alni]